MRDKGQRVHLIAVEQHIDLNEIALAVVDKFIVERRITLGTSLERVEKVINNLTGRHFVVQLDQIGVQILHILKNAAAVLAHRHDVADELLRRHDGRLDIRLASLLDNIRTRIIVRIVAALGRAVGLDDLVDNARQRGDEVKVELAFEPLLNDLHVQHTKKAAAEAEAECDRAFRLKRQRCVIELQFFKCVTQIGILGAVLGVNTAEYHRTCRTIAGQRLRRRIFHTGNGIAHAGVGHLFNRGGKVANLTRTQLLLRRQTKRQHVAALKHLKFCTGGHHFDLHARADLTVKQTHVNDNALVRVVLAVEHECAQRRICIALRRRNISDDTLEHLMNIDIHFCGNFGRILCRNADDILDLLLDTRRVCRRQVDLVDDRHDLQTGVNGKIGVAERLRLNTLCRINDQKRTLTRRQRT